MSMRLSFKFIIFFSLINLSFINWSIINNICLASDFPFDPNDSSSQQIEKGLNEKSSIKADEKSALDEDKMTMGGSLKNEINYFKFKDQATEDFYQNPSTLTLFIDAKVSEGVRGFFKGYFSYDGTVDTANPSSSPVTGETISPTYSQLEELKLQFPVENWVFFTFGIQKIKWGSGKFWNPTDFLNNQTKSLVEKEDRRPGLDLIKMHIPIMDANLYAIGVLEKTNKSKDLSNAIRLEIPMSLSFLSGEISLSQYNKKNNESKFGGDLSLGLGPFDFNFEYATANVENSESSVAGVSYDLQYSDKGLVNFTLESFWNESGAKETAEYVPFIIAKKYVPFQLAKRYNAASIYLPTPGSLKHTDFSLTYIQNDIDKSTYTRFGYYWSGLKNLTLSLFWGGNRGSKESEMKLAGLESDYSMRAEIKF